MNCAKCHNSLKNKNKYYLNGKVYCRDCYWKIKHNLEGIVKVGGIIIKECHINRVEKGGKTR